MDKESSEIYNMIDKLLSSLSNLLQKNEENLFLKDKDMEPVFNLWTARLTNAN